MAETNENQIKRHLEAISKFKVDPEVTARDIERIRQTLTDQNRHQTEHQNIWRTIMKNRMTKLAAAASVILAVFIGIKILGGSAEEPPGHTVTPKGPPTRVEGQRIAEKLRTELSEVRKMAAVGDVKGLATMLSIGQFESKMVAANFLAKMVDLSALEAMSMHASGDLILENQAGKLVLHSTNSTDWLEVNGNTLLLHTDQTIQTATEIRMTHNVGGNSEDWGELQGELAKLRQERVVLEERLGQEVPDVPEDANQLRQRLARVSEILDGLDEAVYVTVDGGRLILDSPFRGCQASAELANGIVRVESQGNVVEANSVTLLFGLRPVRTDGPPRPTQGWRERFDQVYSLDDDQVLCWVRTPFIPERQIYATQELHYYSSTDNPPPPGYLFFRWDGKLYNQTLAMDECNLALVLMSMGLNRYEYSDGPEKLGLLKLGGDWIERDNVPIEDRLLALEWILQNELSRTIRFEKRKVNRDVIIVRGQYKRVPLEGVKSPNEIYVYPDSWEDFSGPEPFDGGGTRSLVKLIEMVGSHFNRQIVFETEDLPDITVGYFTSQSYSLAKANAKTKEDKQEILDSVLQNLSRQTSLQFEYGQRDKDVWFITEQSKTE